MAECFDELALSAHLYCWCVVPGLTSGHICTADPSYIASPEMLSKSATFTYVDPLIEWISNTRPQGCIDLQSLTKCLDHVCYHVIFVLFTLISYNRERNLQQLLRVIV